MRLNPQLSKELVMETKAAKATAPRGVRGIEASQRMVKARLSRAATSRARFNVLGFYLQSGTMMTSSNEYS
jgi:hypothetical protein